MRNSTMHWFNILISLQICALLFEYQINRCLLQPFPSSTIIWPSQCARAYKPFAHITIGSMHILQTHTQITDFSLPLYRMRAIGSVTLIYLRNAWSHTKTQNTFSHKSIVRIFIFILLILLVYIHVCLYISCSPI